MGFSEPFLKMGLETRVAFKASPFIYLFFLSSNFSLSSRFLRLQKAMATTTLLTACSPGFCRLLRRKIDRNRRVRPESRSSRRLSLLLRQKTDPNPLSTTILSVLTASPPDWRVSQVSGERCGGEEVHEGKPHPSSILIPCISDSV